MKLAKNLNLKNLTMALLLLTVAGCGCNDDSFPPGSSPLIINSVLGVATNAPGVPVPPPQDRRQVIPIDVFFVIDDASFMTRETLGNVPFNPGDQRVRSFAAQRIYNNLRENIRQAVIDRINAARAIDPNSVPADIDVNDLDFAFGVGRYEDFGGPFNRRAGDEVARPFILQMPLLRENNPAFAANFATALARQTPGLGTNILNNTELFDPNSGIEALFQIATGDGFDGNGNGNTTDSGQPAVEATQLTPGASGDVPGVDYVANGTDTDGEPIFFLADEGGNATTIQTSGNIGGVGFRPDSARFVILASDTATVSPLTGPPPVCPNRFDVDPTDPVVNPISSSIGAPDSPRIADTIELCGFNGSNADTFQPGGLFGFGSRFGEPEADKDGDNTSPNFAGVAPLGAATVQGTIQELNDLGIEVLSLSATQIAGGPTKPFSDEDTAVNGDTDSTISEVVAFARTGTPWTWLSGIARLTGAADAGPLRNQSGDPKGNPNGGLPLVFNLGDVWLYDPAAPDKSLGNENAPFMTPRLVNDLADRIFHEHIQRGFLRPVVMTMPGAKPALPSVFYDFTLEIIEPEQQSSTLVRVDGLGNIIQVPNVQLPVWYSDETPGAPIAVSFPSLQFNTVNDLVPVPASETYQIKITAVLNRIESDASNAAQAMQIEEYLKVRGNGTFTLAPDGVTLIPNPINDLMAEPVCHTDASITATVREVSDPGIRGVLSALVSGCAIVTDQTPVDGNPMDTQQGGSCPFPPPPPPSLLPMPSFIFLCPGTIEQAATEESGAKVVYATPVADAGQTVTCSPESGEIFPFGSTVVTCEAKDAMDNVVHTCTFTVTVADQQPPVLFCPNSLFGVEESEPGGQSAPIVIPILVMDQVSPESDITVTCNADYPDGTFPDGPIDPSMGNPFPVGNTIVTCEATDMAGNTSSCQVTITVFGVAASTTSSN